jgi:hypothetical protein
MSTGTRQERPAEKNEKSAYVEVSKAYHENFTTTEIGAGLPTK